MGLDYKKQNSASGKDDSLVIFLHGYGADGADLLGLANPLSQHLPDTAFVAPDAPEACRANPFGFQWFPVPWIDGSTPAEMGLGLESSREKMNAFLDQIETDLNFAPQKTVIVGFSQGTMMSLDVIPNREKLYAGIIGFSGRLMEEDRIVNKKNTPPIQLIHGDADEMVAYDSMAKAADALIANGFSVDTHTSPGTGHGIAPDGLSVALSKMRDWLKIS